jgi:hypothetical protein
MIKEQRYKTSFKIDVLIYQATAKLAKTDVDMDYARWREKEASGWMGG